jgi:hypothetical protein
MTQVIEEKPKFLMNSRGFQTPIEDIKPQDLLKHDLVMQLTAQAKEQSKAHEDFKKRVFSEVNDLIALVADEYEVSIGGAKGNVSLTSFDQKKKIQVGIADQISFGSEIDIAKQLITEVIEDELADTSSFIAQLMRDAFESDKQGLYNKNRILALRKYRDANKSDKWVNAMKALDEAIICSNSKTYITFQERNIQGAWVQIPLVSKSL